VLVLPSAAIDVAGDASVKHSRFAGQDVNVEMAHRKAGPSAIIYLTDCAYFANQSAEHSEYLESMTLIVTI
jgi:hypothetical protein